MFRANSLNCKMNTVETQLKDASNKLMHLIAIMAIALKIDSRTLLESKSDEYSPSFCAPAVSHTIKLDFHTRDVHGKFVTPEGVLKHKVLSSVSSKSVTYATGALNPAHGVLGMAGVGKTIALQGLASDQDVRTRFPDGIQYLSLGQAAGVQTAIQEIARVMRLAGATVSAAPVEGSTTMREAVDYAFRWFQNRQCLFLIMTSGRQRIVPLVTCLIFGNCCVRVQGVGWLYRLAALTSQLGRVLL